MSAVAVAAAVICCMIFPNKYGGYIDKAADEFSLSPALVRSVVWAESKFNRDAVSEKGALGLMQLMPDTFEFCRKALAYAPSEADVQC